MSEDELFELGLYRICEALHMSNMGSSDLMADDERSAMVDYLLKRIAKWKPSTPASDAYDNVVKTLVYVTLAEKPYTFRGGTGQR